ncbi:MULTISPECIES: DUF2500 domain-containing protein [unclassified Lysinibacillus]|uniref:DUF2500 domain-containing protein n=1 Tax=unclassified Lysinibacillus TaxID=2636778 RepID=UPI000738A5C5|nr:MULTISPECIES: DUF2500 domain-containing protein [unclassified Lysinibacillus]KUF31072.1 hypothetical protein AK833_16300 [Lysinibacillus sp. F5]SCZ01104.1 Protein of unknown function [Lysinibacillus sp. SG9]SDB48214.1 Protein of unknown function [Lysinibacillus sp. TC-37]SFS77901.1 Protein of unknown function [Lysinibacillus sp. SG55]
MPWFDDQFLFGSVFITIIFFIVFGSIAFIVVKGIISWSKNNSSPILTVPAKVVTKRTNIRGGSNNTGASTSYYVTFEELNGERHELKMNGHDYGLLVDGDFGILTYQGTRYHSFNRHKKESSD